MVVTSDSTNQDTVFGDGVDRMSAEGFCREMELHYDSARLDEKPVVARKSTIAGRISPDTLEKLRALRDSGCS